MATNNGGADISDVEAIFSAAIEIASPPKRAAYVAAACGPNVDRKARVEQLVEAHFRAGSFLESPLPAVDFAAEMQEGPGSVFGPYKLLEQIGEGGMGVVYMAEQTAPVRRKVALKIIKPGMDTRQVIARFEAERQALAMMDHPNIAKVLDAGVVTGGSPVSSLSTGEPPVPTGRPYFVMELVKGVAITKYCDEQQLSLRERLELFLPVCQAVQHAHQKGIIHRDLKPSNVLVAEYDGRPVPRIIDFGVAKATAQPLTERTMFTQYGQIVGTFEYMSPEQARFNQLDVDTRSDIYSLGVMLYELLTGSTPLEKERVRSSAFDEILRMIRDEEPPKPSTRLSSSSTLALAGASHATKTASIAANRRAVPKKLIGILRGELDWIVMKCLEKDRDRRYETAGALGDDIERYLHDEPVEARPATAIYRLKKLIRRNKAAVLASSAIVLALTVGFIAVAWGFFQARQQAEFNRIEAVRSTAVAQFLKDTLAAAGPSVARGRDAALLREVLEKAAVRVEMELNDQPEIQGELWFTIGTTFIDIRNFSRAAEMLERAVESFRRTPGGDARKLALALANLGWCQSFNGAVATGKLNAQNGLDLARRSGDKETLASCLLLAGKACDFYGFGPSESVPYCREAIALYRQLNTHPVALADCLRALSNCDELSFAESEPLVREALALHREHLGSDHPKVANDLDGLGQLLFLHGDMAEAEKAYAETMALYRKVHDPRYAYQRSTRRGWVQTLIPQEKWEHAEAVARQAGDPDSPDGVDWDLLGRMNAYRGRWDEASSQLTRAVITNPSMDKYRLAVALAENGQHDDYRRLRREYFAGYGGYSPDGARAIAFLLHPIDADELATLEQLLNKFDRTKMGPLNASRGRLDKALAAYRLGKFQLALEAASPAVVEGARPSNQAQAWFIQALAAIGLRQISAAEAALAQGDRLFAEGAGNVRCDFLEDFFDWEIARFLRAEAAKTLQH